MVFEESKMEDGYQVTFRLGRNQNENDDLYFDADDNDWWFHLDGLASGHCYIDFKPTENVNFNLPTVPSKEDILYASLLVKSKSKFSNKKVKVIYTQKSNLKKGKAKGEIIIKNLKKVNSISI